ncbi:hypothetical protein TcWFU_001780 [Taenia crassiceps]|uniref:Uncharacterized protein n=1 Tax=Taenia crassiceps TaxID=6207 RepID=A0ABR4QG63_9CEST
MRRGLGVLHSPICAYVRVCTSQRPAPIIDNPEALLRVSSPSSLFTSPFALYRYSGFLPHLHTQPYTIAVSEEMANYGTAVLAQTTSDNPNPAPSHSMPRSNLRRQRHHLGCSFSPLLQDMNATTATIIDSNHPQFTKGNQLTRQVRITSSPDHKQERSGSFGYKSRSYGFSDSRPRMISQEMTEM